MPAPNLTQASGSDINELIDSLEKQRKELNWILQHLDNSNVVELNADVINAGTINGERIVIDDTVTFAGGYDPTILQTTVNTQFSVMNGVIASKASSTVVDGLGTRVYTAEQNINGLNGTISQKVSYTDYNGYTIASMIVQDYNSINLIANNINLQGYVTFTSLRTPGQAVIDGGNIAANLLRIGNMSGGTALDIYGLSGSHRITSYDANGFRIESTGTLSLQAGSGWTVYSNSKFWASAGLEVSGTGQFNSNVSVAGELSANSMYKGGRNVATTDEVSGSISLAIRQLENDIKAWANGKFALK